MWMRRLPPASRAMQAACSELHRRGHDEARVIVVCHQGQPRRAIATRAPHTVVCAALGADDPQWVPFGFSRAYWIPS